MKNTSKRHIKYKKKQAGCVGITRQAYSWQPYFIGQASTLDNMGMYDVNSFTDGKHTCILKMPSG